MKKVIYCFSGTGNCMDAAIKIATKMENTQIISMKCNPLEVGAIDAEMIGFIFPVHHWSLPEYARTFIEKVQINTKAYIFGVTVCGGIAFNTLDDFRRIIERKGAKVSYARMIKSVASYVAAYEPFPKADKVLPQSERDVIGTAQEICKKEIKLVPKRNYLLAAIRTPVQGTVVKGLLSKDKGFVVSAECVSCGLCSKVCIANNIEIVDKKPVFRHQCTQCMSCIVFCPKQAINYKDKTQKRTKYHNPNIGIQDMISLTREV